LGKYITSAVEVRRESHYQDCKYLTSVNKLNKCDITTLNTNQKTNLLRHTALNGYYNSTIYLYNQPKFIKNIEDKKSILDDLTSTKIKNCIQFRSAEYYSLWIQAFDWIKNNLFACHTIFYDNDNGNTYEQIAAIIYRDIEI